MLPLDGPDSKRGGADNVISSGWSLRSNIHGNQPLSPSLHRGVGVHEEIDVPRFVDLLLAPTAGSECHCGSVERDFCQWIYKWRAWDWPGFDVKGWDDGNRNSLLNGTRWGCLVLVWTTLSELQNRWAGASRTDSVRRLHSGG